uniref:Uncharacterized protein n=1 Tax=Arundo donax TaxID=35708 RepID=A0A0A9AMB2_ARUDO
MQYYCYINITTCCIFRNHVAD